MTIGSWLVMILTMTISCYCQAVSSIAGNTTYSGVAVQTGHCACPSEYRIGTEFWLDGGIDNRWRRLVCADRGRLVRTELWPLPPLDVWEADCSKCRKWGRQTRRVTIWRRLPVAI